jgi:hypothetical protein
VIRFPRSLPMALLAAALAGCAHGDTFAPLPPAQAGPFSTALPRRLTWFAGMDATPSVRGGTLVFSRQDDAEPGPYQPGGRERCIAFMPVEGGTIERMLCPDRYIALPDTFVDTWYDAVVSPAGDRIAFMWQRGLRVSALGFADAFLMVTSLDHPADTTQVRHQVQWVETGGAQNPLRATVATRITWEDAGHLLFLATYEHILKVKGGGSERVTDSTYDGLALLRLDLASGVASLVPGGDSVVAYAPAAGGGLWIAKKGDPLIRRLDPVSGTSTVAGALDVPMVELAEVDGLPVAIPVDSTRIEWLDAGGVLREMRGFNGKVHRLASAGGRRFVIEVEDGTGSDPFGSPPDLWLLAIP